MRAADKYRFRTQNAVSTPSILSTGDELTAFRERELDFGLQLWVDSAYMGNISFTIFVMKRHDTLLDMAETSFLTDRAPLKMFNNACSITNRQ